MFRQKLHFFKWKLWKYETAAESYLLEQNNRMVDMCNANCIAYRKAFKAAHSQLVVFEEKLKNHVV